MKVEVRLAWISIQLQIKLTHRGAYHKVTILKYERLVFSEFKRLGKHDSDIVFPSAIIKRVGTVGSAL